MSVFLRGPYRLLTVLLLFLAVNIFAVYILTQSQIDQGDNQRISQQLTSQTMLINKLRHELNLTKTQLFNLTQTIEKQRLDFKNFPTIFMITPTYKRWTQKADLTRLCLTLMHVQKLHWIIVEDSEQKTRLVSRLLSGLDTCKVYNGTQLNIRTPEQMRLSENEPTWHKNRGVEQRNLAIDWLREQWAEGGLDKRGVVYFGDDDNTYDVALFDEMRYTDKVSVWLVGITGGLKFEGPVCKNGRVTEWYAAWGKEREFPIDMAGFAVNLDLLCSKPTAYIDPKALRGNLESSLLRHLVTTEELEGKPHDCRKVLVWHTRTEKPKMKQEDKLIQLGKPSNPHIEV